jgi:YcaO-like protein with predicted kinase domain
VPVKIPDGEFPPELRLTAGAMYNAGLYPFLFDCTSNLGIPVVGCALLGTDGVGAFGGYGANMNPRVAAMRALTEAAQSRLCWIGGARDDLYRRDFLRMKNASASALIKQLMTMPSAWETWTEYATTYRDHYPYNSTREELQQVTHWLNQRGIHLYYRQLNTADFGEGNIVTVVKVISPDLEGYYFEYWATNGRALEHLKRETHSEQ